MRARHPSPASPIGPEVGVGGPAPAAGGVVGRAAPSEATGGRSRWRRLACWPEVATIVGTVVVVAMVPLLEVEQLEWIFATEQSIVEWASVVAWVLLALSLPLLLRRWSLRVAAASIVALAAAGREAGMHLAFTDYSILKIPFYYRAEHPLPTRLVVGAIMITLLLSIVVVIVTLLRRVIESERDRRIAAGMTSGAGPGVGFRRSAARRIGLWSGPPHAIWVRCLGSFGVVLVVSKILDRAPAIVRKHWAELPEMTVNLLLAAEETLEFFLPILLVAAAISYGRRGGRGGRAATTAVR